MADFEIPEHIREAIKVGRKAEAQDRERAELCDLLVRHPGWGAFNDLLRARIELIGTALTQPSGGLDGAFMSEFQKGAMFGLLFAQALPHVIVESMKHHLSEIED